MAAIYWLVYLPLSPTGQYYCSAKPKGSNCSHLCEQLLPFGIASQHRPNYLPTLSPHSAEPQCESQIQPSPSMSRSDVSSYFNNFPFKLRI